MEMWQQTDFVLMLIDSNQTGIDPGQREDFDILFQQ